MHKVKQVWGLQYVTLWNCDIFQYERVRNWCYHIAHVLLWAYLLQQNSIVTNSKGEDIDYNFFHLSLGTK